MYQPVVLGWAGGWGLVAGGWSLEAIDLTFAPVTAVRQVIDRIALLVELN